MPICSRLNGHQGVRASSKEKHADPCVFSAPILNSGSRGSLAKCDVDDRGPEGFCLTYDEHTVCALEYIGSVDIQDVSDIQNMTHISSVLFSDPFPFLHT